MLFICHRAVTLRLISNQGGRCSQRPAAFQNKPAASRAEMPLLTVGEEASEDITAVPELLWLCVCVVRGVGVVCQGSEHTCNQVRTLLLSITGSVGEKCRILRLVFLEWTIGNSSFTGCIEGGGCVSQSCPETELSELVQGFIITARRGRAGAEWLWL